MDKKSEKMKNVLVFREKPYYTDEEQELYYKIAIDESLKQGHPELAAHYQILLDYAQKMKNTSNRMSVFKKSGTAE